ncbi:MAG TPA: hypothetical protein VLU25_00945 [Acidobacteriota bacterium]|nr:hypothetical protein [Acidobacteriota bacterium]
MIREQRRRHRVIFLLLGPLLLIMLALALLTRPQVPPSGVPSELEEAVPKSPAAPMGGEEQ